MNPFAITTAALVFAGLFPLALLWVRAGKWAAAPRRAFRTGAAAAAAYAVAAVVASGGAGAMYWVPLGALVPLALVGVALDRADARERLLGRQQHLDRFRMLDAALNASRDGVLVTAAGPNLVGLQIVFANPAFEELTGYGTDEAIGQSPSMLYAEASDIDRDKVQDALRAGTPGRFEVLARRKDGSRVWVEWDIVPVPGAPDGCAYRVAVLRDTTERRRLEEQLRNAAKLEAVGRLAAGVAHDFNNLLTVIGGTATLLGDMTTGAPGAARLTDELNGALDQAGWLVRQLLTFSRPRPAGREVLDLGRVVSDLAGILTRVVGSGVAVEVDAPAGAPVRADRGELEQVVMNLAVNARDAMPDGGRLRVRVRTNAGASRLEVTDSGHGMTDVVKARIFEPFFTTKEPEKGTGLGLATVRQVVDRCGGRIAVESAPGRGTTFGIDFPPCPTSAPSSVRTPANTPAPVGPHRSVLLVDDEPGVRSLARAVLQGRGYRVTEAADGSEALALLDAGRGFDLLVTDVRMPGADGVQVADRARVVLPNVGVVFMSAFTDALPAVPGSVFLPKPFVPAVLVQVVDRLRASLTNTAQGTAAPDLNRKLSDSGINLESTPV